MKVKAADHFKVGDIVYNTWGYGQTNIDFYKVVSVTEVTVGLQGIAAKVTPSGTLNSYGHAEPLPDQAAGHYATNFDSSRILRKRVREGEGPYLAFPHGFGLKWDGKPQHCSWDH